MYCTEMDLYYVLYRDGSILWTVPGWFCILQCTGMVLNYVLYRDGSVLCTVPGWFCIMYCIGMVLYYVLYQDGSILCTVPGWFCLGWPGSTWSDWPPPVGWWPCTQLCLTHFSKLKQVKNSNYKMTYKWTNYSVITYNLRKLLLIDIFIINK